MKILAFEFSSSQRSVAAVWPRQNSGGFGHSFAETISRKADGLAMADEVLTEVKWEREQVECIAVGLGPGSYTGVRAAIALAQGWQLARGTKVIGISSVKALATQAHSDGLRGRICLVIDAQRKEFYASGYKLSEAGVEETDPLRLVNLSNVQQREAAENLLIGPEIQRWFPKGRVIFPRAAALGILALRATDFAAAEELKPIYLRETSFRKTPQREDSGKRGFGFRP